MNDKTKVIAMYLPQYHRIYENDKFWGDGFTDWTTVKNAKPLFEGHNQPKVPLNNNYYDLSDEKNIRWQVELAKKYGIYGFGIYHYWFNNEKNLLTKPSEIILANKDIDINFCFAWDNSSWKRSWSNVKGGSNWAPLYDQSRGEKARESPYLVEHILGDEPEWKKHFDYLLPFFKDCRYIRKDDKPVFIIWHNEPKIIEMTKYWNLLALQAGFNGIYFIVERSLLHNPSLSVPQFMYEPSYYWDSIKDRVLARLKKYLRIKKIKVSNYDSIWNFIIKKARKNKVESMYYGAIVAFDDTPRRGKRGSIIKNATPRKFKAYMSRLLDICKKQKKEFLFLTAWNEWGEGAMLEPDEENGYSYLEACGEAIGKMGE